MSQLNIFVIRAVFGLVFAVLLSRFFFTNANLFHIAGLSIFLVGMAYVSEYFRNRKSR